MRLHPPRALWSASADDDLPPVGMEPQNLSGMSWETPCFTLGREALDGNLRELERLV